MKTKRILSIILTLALSLCLFPGTASAATYDPIFVTSNGVTSTGDFDSLFSGQIIYYPASLPESDETYPVIVWANGTMCAPALYHSLLSKIAAGGYIVVTNTDMMAANGESQRKSIAFILAENADPDGLKSAKKALEERVIHEARSISKYISVPKTTPFAIMYLASEGLYAEIASSPNAIPERLQSDFNIMVAGPSTITALLNSLSMGFKIAAINEKANEVRKILSAVKAQYDTFSTVLAKAKKKIDEAGKSLDDAQHRNEIIQKKLKSIEEVDVSSSNEVLGIEESTDLDE
jgi:uncharacterized membrane protein YfbV (UPF0208 family)